MAEATLTINHEVGLHARPASLFVKKAQSFASTITVTNLTTGSDPADAKSILRVLKLAVAQGHSIKIQADGDDADEAVSELAAMIEGNFGE